LDTGKISCAGHRRRRSVTPMSANRMLVSSGSDFESTVGYSRAVRVGPYVAVAGTTGTGPADDIAAQAQDALRRIEIALQEAGASLADVVRTRMYVKDISRWREVAAVHARVFGEIRPVATMVEVSALIAPELLVEIEADAYVGSSELTTGANVPPGPGK
jgi:enamine deaminase RidA (YjgF/YER057c/UK114 family)